MEDAMFDKLCESIEQATAHAKGEEDLGEDQIHFVDEPDPRSIRKKLDLTQREFAGLLDVSVDTIRNWEQGRRKPQGPAETLLRVADHDPQALLDLVGGAGDDAGNKTRTTVTISYSAKQRQSFGTEVHEHQITSTRLRTSVPSARKHEGRSADDYSYAMAV